MFKAADVPIEFEEFWISEVQDRCSQEEIDQMIDSVSRNKVAIKGSRALICSLTGFKRFLLEIALVIHARFLYQHSD